MSDDTDATKGKAGEPEPEKKKAEDNPWYLLAMLYRVPKSRKFVLTPTQPTQLDFDWEKNRLAWNRYFAANLDEETRRKLIEEKRHPKEELTPFSPKELQEVATAFAERCKASAKNLIQPSAPTSIFQISNLNNVLFL